MFKKEDAPFYKFIFLALLLVPFQLISLELIFAILFLLVIYFLNKRDQKLSGGFITTVLFLLIIFVIGISSTFFYNYHFWDIGKDIVYFLRPVLMLFIGYAIIGKIKDQKFLFKAFIFMSIAFAIYHIFKIISYPNFINTSINTLRNAAGLSNNVELFALIFLLLSFKYPKIRVFNNKKTTNAIIALLFVSFFLYFSRTMWVAVFLILLTSFGYAKISLKALKYLGLFILLIAGLYIYLYSIEINRNETGIDAFLYKIKIAPEEIYSPKIDLNNHATLWDHWRAYEAKMAFEQMKGYQHIIGRGFGSLVDLHFIAPLNDQGMRFISNLHNGYAFIYYKTGIIGLLFYLLFLLNLYLFTFYKKTPKSEISYSNLIASIGVYLIFSSLIVSGVYNLFDIDTLTLGGFYALYDKQKSILI